MDGDVALLVERNDIVGAAAGTGVQCQTATLTLDNTVLGFASQATGCTALAP